MNPLLPFTSTLILLVGIAGCVNEEPKSQDHTAVPDTTPTVAIVSKAGSGPFDDRLLKIAHTYETYGRMDAHYRLSPALCQPIMPLPQARISASADEGTHGRKLYSLFVKDRPNDDYLADYTPKEGPNPIGQVVVKEAWRAEEIEDKGQRLEPITRKVNVRFGSTLDEVTDSFLPYVRKDGRLYHAGGRAELFIMYKTDPQTPGTDLGWVYGTVTADGERVISAGRLDSCMGCHRDAPHDRLFGLYNK